MFANSEDEQRWAAYCDFAIRVARSQGNEIYNVALVGASLMLMRAGGGGPNIDS